MDNLEKAIDYLKKAIEIIQTEQARIELEKQLPEGNPTLETN